MGKCQICGKPTKLNFPLCNEHYEQYNEGNIVQCEYCDTYHEYDMPCPECGAYDTLPNQGFNECILCGEKTKGHAFCKDCWKEYDDEDLLDILNKHVMEDQEEICIENNSVPKTPCIEEEITCIICGSPSNGKHFCLKCYRKYKEKVILLKVHKCEFPTGEPLDESYEGVYECQDGHIVKSIAEQTIDDELYNKGIFHAYESPLDIGEHKPLKPDFCLKNYLGEGKDVYIEYFGLKGQPKYDEHTQYKMEHYRRLGITLICLYPKDSKNLKFALQSKVFNKDKIKIGKINYEEK